MLQNNLYKLVSDNKLRVVLDSRQVEDGDYFVPVVGESHDGHAYCEQALASGAAGIIEEEDLYILARYKLNKIKPVVIGVTGSAGKTTTSSFIFQLLSHTHTVCFGDLNTKLGLSVNIINKMTPDCKIFVAEMGMDRIGELLDTTELIKPHIALITAINEAHLEKLGSMENIIKSKFDIASRMSSDDILILNIDDFNIKSYLRNKRITPRVITYGIPAGDVTANNTDTSRFTIPGDHILLDLLGSLTVIRSLGFEIEHYYQYLNELKMPKGRLNKLEGLNNSIIFDDTYNASPDSTCNALETIARQEKSHKIAILGGMLELGEYEEEGHIKVANTLNSFSFDAIVTVGTQARIIYHHLKCSQKYHIDSSSDFEKVVKGKIDINKDTVILVKGSQGIRMEYITKSLMMHPEEAEKYLVRQDVRWK